MTMITGDDINLFRLLTLQKGLKAEINGFRLTRGRTCYSIIKSEFGLKGTKQRVYDQYSDYLKQITQSRSQVDHEQLLSS